MHNSLFDLFSNTKPYLDPGSGSFILQLVIAALLGGAVIIRAYWSRIKTLFRKGSNTPSQEDQDDEQ